MRFLNTVTWRPGITNVSDDEIRQLPQFFRSDIDFVYRLGGPIYREVLANAPLLGGRRYISIDARVHMLKPGWWPCIPGWHCDDFYRPHGQPDLRAIARREEFNATHHSLFLGATAPTEFLVEPLEIPESVLDSARVYEEANDCIVRRQAPSRFARPGEFATFDSLVWHRGTQATRSGWRLFIRITESDHYEPMNELRTQTQVYLTDAGAGW